MARIDGYISNIQMARYGEQVRGSIVDAIEAINTEVEGNTRDVATAVQNIDNKIGEFDAVKGDTEQAINEKLASVDSAVSDMNSTVEAKMLEVDTAITNTETATENANNSADRANQTIDELREVFRDTTLIDDTTSSDTSTYSSTKIDSLVAGIGDTFNSSAYYTKVDTDSTFLKQADASDTYVTKVDAEDTYLKKTEVPTLPSNIVTDEDLANYYTKEEADNAFNEKINITTEIINNATTEDANAFTTGVNDGSVVNLNNYYTKSESDDRYALKGESSSGGGSSTVSDTGWLTSSDGEITYRCRDKVVDLYYFRSFTNFAIKNHWATLPTEYLPKNYIWGTAFAREGNSTTYEYVNDIGIRICPKTDQAPTLSLRIMTNRTANFTGSIWFHTSYLID